jgi:hypothetical protein
MTATDMTAAQVSATCDMETGTLARIQGIGGHWAILPTTRPGYLVVEYGDGPGHRPGATYRTWLFAGDDVVGQWAAALRFTCELSVSELAAEMGC